MGQNLLMEISTSGVYQPTYNKGANIYSLSLVFTKNYFSDFSAKTGIRSKPKRI